MSMTVNELISKLQEISAQGNGDLEIARYDAEYGDYIPLKTVSKKQHPKGMDNTYIPYGNIQAPAITFVALL